MSRRPRERNGWRDLSYSQWHRSLPKHFHAYDVDLLEVCHRCGEPLMLTEVAHRQGDGSRHRSSGRWLRRLAEAAGVPAYEAYYERERELTREEWAILEEAGKIDWPAPARFWPSLVWSPADRPAIVPPAGPISADDWAKVISAVRDLHRCGRGRRNR